METATDRAISRLDRLFKPRHRPTATKKPPSPVETPREKAFREAREADQRRWRKYLEARASRLAKLTSVHSGAARYLMALEKLAPTTTVLSRRDVDVDLAALVDRYGLDTIPSPYDRFLLVEYTGTWITTLKGGMRLGIDDLDPLPFDGRDPETLDDLKAALHLS